MAEGDRLGLLHMGVGGDHRAGVLGGPPGECADESLDLVRPLGDRAPQVQPQVQRYLVVAGAAGVQLARGVSDELSEPSLHRAVDVLVIFPVVELAGSCLALDAAQALLYRCSFVRLEEADTFEHRAVRQRALDVDEQQPLIGSIDGEAPEVVRRTSVESAAPESHSPSPMRFSAKVRSRSDCSRMNPVASAWS